MDFKAESNEFLLSEREIVLLNASSPVWEASVEGAKRLLATINAAQEREEARGAGLPEGFREARNARYNALFADMRIFVGQHVEIPLSNDDLDQILRG